MAAVDLARAEQIRTLSSLRARLATYFPSAPAAVDEALAFWGSHLRSKGP